MLILIFFAFLAGIVTVLSPCILPILPVVLSGSLSGGKKLPIGIVLGFIASFTFFTLALSAIVRATGLSADALRTVAILTIGLFGVSLLFPQTQVLLEKIFSKMSSLFTLLSPKGGSSQDQGLLGGLVVGLSIGLLWTPCVGPILASVITLALSGSTNFTALLITLAYSIGTGLPMLAITYGGRALLQRVPWLLANTARIQKGFGVVMIALSLALYFNVDRQFQTIILRTFPQYGAGLTALENNELVQKQLSELNTTTPPLSSLGREEGRDLSPLAKGGSGNLSPLTKGGSKGGYLPDLGLAPNPSFTGATKWLDGNALSLESNLKGKVVLVDFWTYTCINCIRTLPYLRDWYSKYKDAGLVIVGVHSPEFEFEKSESNVREAIRDLQVTWPVVQDNDFAIWKSYDNHYWPAHYLIDRNGHVRQTHFGEGKYKETEEAIQELLKEAGASSLPEVTTKEDRAEFPLRIGRQQTPETYLGSERAESYTSTQVPSPSMEEGQGEVREYSYSDPLASNEVGIRGKWIVEKERITSAEDTATLTMHFNAAKVHLVLSSDTPKTIMVMSDGLPLVEYCKDCVTSDYTAGSQILVNKARKYDIFQSSSTLDDYVTLIVPKGVSAYAFTFGE